ncbi:LOW QUALITY PROTEIN: vps35 Vacuolar protein sorting-associated protein 35 [Candida maltosa Xu316]
MPLSTNDKKAILQSCINNITHQSNMMKNDLNENKLLPALKHCSNFLNELRTNSLTPKQYYEIYMLVFDSLEILSSYLLSTYKSKQKAPSRKSNTSNTNSNGFLADLYEIVQYSGNIIPRLYMMIVIGTTYMSIEGAPTKDLMKDMIEMCHGVQHPIRGLFLRYYLSQRTKNLLPFGNQLDFQETVDFLISNFIEMNKLWVRLQHQGHSSERELRYRERKELKILVGSNLVRLSQVIDDYNNGKDENYSAVEYYKEKIFPTITEQIIQCRDHLAQTYLIDVLIQVFPDDFHFATLDMLLNQVFVNLHPLLKRSELVQTLIDRFIAYEKFASDMADLSVSENKDDDEKKEKEQDSRLNKINVDELFKAFWQFYINLNESDPELPSEEHSVILQSLLLTFDSENYTNLDVIYKFAEESLSKEHDEEQQEMWSQLLFEPINHFKSIKSILKLENFYEFYNKLGNKNFQKEISLALIDKVLSLAIENGEVLTTTEEIDGVFKYFTVLIKESPSKLDTAKSLGITKTIKINNGEKLITPEYLETLEKVSKVVQLIEVEDDPLKNISNLMYVRKNYLNKNYENIIFTYPTLINKILFKLKIIGYVNLKQKSKDVQTQIISQFKNLSVIIDELYQHHQEHSSDLILRIYLNVASVADQLKLQSIAYELFTQCFVVYEENLVLTSNQYKNYSQINPHDSLGGSSLAYESILAIANALRNTKNLSKDNYEELITKVTLYGSRLLKKQDQARAVLSCANLWSSGGATDEESSEVIYSDDKRLLECLQKSLRVADGTLDPYLGVKLFLEILNHSLIFNVYGNPYVDEKFIGQLVDLIKTNIDNLSDEDELLNQSDAFYKRILDYIESSKT